MKKYLSVLLLIVMVLSLASCGGNEKEGVDLVKVGETTINESELEQYLQFWSFSQGIDLSQFPEESIEAFRAQMLDDMVSMEVIKQYYAGKEKEVLPETMEADLNNFLQDAKKTEAVNSFLKEKNIGDETLKAFMYNQNYIQAYFEEVKAGMANLEEDAQGYYESNTDSFKVDEVTAGHILVEKEATAKEILGKLEAGEKFEELAKEYGTDGTKDNGGSLGTFGRGQMVKEFEDAVFALEAGELSDIVKTEFGYHIIRVTEKNQGTRTYEEVKESIISNLVSEEAQNQLYDLKESADIEHLTDEYTENKAG